MAVYYTITCPQCKKTIESGKNRSKRFGSPLRRCRYCGGTYVDKDYIEAGLLTDNELKLQVLGMYTSNLAIGALLLVLDLICITQEQSAFSIILAIIMFSISALLFVSAYRGYHNDLKNLPKIIDESTARLANPYYLLALYKAGFSIPTDMLKKAMKEVSEDEPPHN